MVDISHLAKGKYGILVLLRPDGSVRSSMGLLDKFCMIGNLENCHVRLRVPGVSRYHARIEVDASNENNHKAIVRVVSRNGIKLDGKEVEEGQIRPLENGSIINIMERHFLFEKATGEHEVRKDQKKKPESPKASTRVTRKSLATISKADAPKSAQREPLVPKSNPEPEPIPSAPIPSPVSSPVLRRSPRKSTKGRQSIPASQSDRVEEHAEEQCEKENIQSGSAHDVKETTNSKATQGEVAVIGEEINPEHSGKAGQQQELESEGDLITWEDDDATAAEEGDDKVVVEEVLIDLEADDRVERVETESEMPFVGTGLEELLQDCEIKDEEAGQEEEEVISEVKVSISEEGKVDTPPRRRANLRYPESARHSKVVKSVENFKERASRRRSLRMTIGPSDPVVTEWKGEMEKEREREKVSAKDESEPGTTDEVDEKPEEIQGTQEYPAAATPIIRRKVLNHAATARKPDQNRPASTSDSKARAATRRSLRMTIGPCDPAVEAWKEEASKGKKEEILEREEEANLSAHESVESDSDSEDETPLAHVGSKDEVRMATPPTTKYRFQGNPAASASRAVKSELETTFKEKALKRRSLRMTIGPSDSDVVDWRQRSDSHDKAEERGVACDPASAEDSDEIGSEVEKESEGHSQNGPSQEREDAYNEDLSSDEEVESMLIQPEMIPLPDSPESVCSPPPGFESPSSDSSFLASPSPSPASTPIRTRPIPDAPMQARVTPRVIQPRTPTDQVAQIQQQPPATPPSMPSTLPNRRLSLREKVILRSAVKAATVVQPPKSAPPASRMAVTVVPARTSSLSNDSPTDQRSRIDMSGYDSGDDGEYDSGSDGELETGERVDPEAEEGDEEEEEEVLPPQDDVEMTDAEPWVTEVEAAVEVLVVQDTDSEEEGVEEEHDAAASASEEDETDESEEEDEEVRSVLSPASSPRPSSPFVPSIKSPREPASKGTTFRMPSDDEDEDGDSEEDPGAETEATDGDDGDEQLESDQGEIEDDDQEPSSTAFASEEVREVAASPLQHPLVRQGSGKQVSEPSTPVLEFEQQREGNPEVQSPLRSPRRSARFSSPSGEKARLDYPTSCPRPQPLAAMSTPEASARVYRSCLTTARANRVSADTYNTRASMSLKRKVHWGEDIIHHHTSAGTTPLSAKRARLDLPAQTLEQQDVNLTPQRVPISANRRAFGPHTPAAAVLRARRATIGTAVTPFPRSPRRTAQAPQSLPPARRVRPTSASNASSPAQPPLAADLRASRTPLTDLVEPQIRQSAIPIVPNETSDENVQDSPRPPTSLSSDDVRQQTRDLRRRSLPTSIPAPSTPSIRPRLDVRSASASSLKERLASESSSPLSLANTRSDHAGDLTSSPPSKPGTPTRRIVEAQSTSSALETVSGPPKKHNTSEESSSKARQLQTPRYGGLRRIFEVDAKQKVAAPSTPSFGGLHKLFTLPAEHHFAPTLEGVRRVKFPVVTPALGAIRRLFNAEPPSNDLDSHLDGAFDTIRSPIAQDSASGPLSSAPGAQPKGFATPSYNGMRRLFNDKHPTDDMSPYLEGGLDLLRSPAHSQEDAPPPTGAQTDSPSSDKTLDPRNESASPPTRSKKTPSPTLDRTPRPNLDARKEGAEAGQRSQGGNDSPGPRQMPEEAIPESSDAQAVTSNDEARNPMEQVAEDDENATKTKRKPVRKAAAKRTTRRHATDIETEGDPSDRQEQGEPSPKLIAPLPRRSGRPARTTSDDPMEEADQAAPKPTIGRTATRVRGVRGGARDRESTPQELAGDEVAIPKKGASLQRAVSPQVAAQEEPAGLTKANPKTKARGRPAKSREVDSVQETVSSAASEAQEPQPPAPSEPPIRRARAGRNKAPAESSTPPPGVSSSHTPVVEAEAESAPAPLSKRGSSRTKSSTAPERSESPSLPEVTHRRPLRREGPGPQPDDSESHPTPIVESGPAKRGGRSGRAKATAASAAISVAVTTVESEAAELDSGSTASEVKAKTRRSNTKAQDGGESVLAVAETPLQDEVPVEPAPKTRRATKKTDDTAELKASASSSLPVGKATRGRKPAAKENDVQPSLPLQPTQASSLDDTASHEESGTSASKKKQLSNPTKSSTKEDEFVDKENDGNNVARGRKTKRTAVKVKKEAVASSVPAGRALRSRK